MPAGNSTCTQKSSGQSTAQMTTTTTPMQPHVLPKPTVAKSSKYYNDERSTQH